MKYRHDLTFAELVVMSWRLEDVDVNVDVDEDGLFEMVCRIVSSPAGWPHHHRGGLRVNDEETLCRRSLPQGGAPRTTTCTLHVF